MKTRAFIKVCSTCDHLFAVRNRPTAVAIWPGEVCPWCGNPTTSIIQRLRTFTEAIALARALRQEREAPPQSVEVAA